MSCKEHFGDSCAVFLVTSGQGGHVNYRDVIGCHTVAMASQPANELTRVYSFFNHSFFGRLRMWQMIMWGISVRTQQSSCFDIIGHCRFLFSGCFILKWAGIVSFFFWKSEGFWGAVRLSGRWNQCLSKLKTHTHRWAHTHTHSHTQNEAEGEELHPSLHNDASPKTPPVYFFQLAPFISSSSCFFASHLFVF